MITKKLLKLTTWAFDITLWIAAFVVLYKSFWAGDWKIVVLSILGISAYAEARLGRLERDKREGEEVKE